MSVVFLVHNSLNKLGRPYLNGACRTTASLCCVRVLDATECSCNNCTTSCNVTLPCGDRVLRHPFPHHHVPGQGSGFPGTTIH